MAFQKIDIKDLDMNVFQTREKDHDSACQGGTR